MSIACTTNAGCHHFEGCYTACPTPDMTDMSSKDKIRILVVSHRRSGTHLTIDSLVNNFPDLRNAEFITLEQVKPGHVTHIPVADMRRMTETGKAVIMKTHYLPGLSGYGLPDDARLFVEEVFREYKIIYAYRHGLDVMVSLYNYMKQYDEATRKIAFPDFIRQNNNFDPGHDTDRISFWAHHLRSWLEGPLADRILPVKFEDWTTDYAGTIKRLSAGLSLRHKKAITDITLRTTKQTSGRIIRKMKNLFGLQDSLVTTSILPGKGKTEAWKDHFESGMIDDISVQAREAFATHGYSLI